MPLQDEGLTVGELTAGGKSHYGLSPPPLELAGNFCTKSSHAENTRSPPAPRVQREKMMLKLTTPYPKWLKSATSGELSGQDL